MNTKSNALPVRWGLLSTARINRAVIPPIRRSKDSKLVAVSSRDQAHAIQYAQEWGIPKAYGSYEAMLEDPEIDAVYISLPNAFHAEWSIKAMEAGKHVLCEKPLCLSIAELDRITATSQKTGRYITEAFMYRHHPQTLKVKELVNSGAIGEVRLIRGTFTYRLDNPTNPRLSTSLGGGSIWDVGCYPISYTRWIMGSEPEEAFGWQVTSQDGIDLSFVGQMRFSNQVYAQFDSSFDMTFRVNMEIVGNSGSLTIPNPYKPGKKEKIFLRRNNKMDAITINGQELYIGEINDLENCILRRQSPRISLAESRGNLTVITALLESARLGHPIILKQS